MENLKNKIREKFMTLGWVKDEVLDYWTHDQEVVRNQGTLIINGQPVQRQGEKVVVSQRFEICYDCPIKTVDTDDVHETVMCRWAVYENDDATQYLEINLYCDEYYFFEDLCKKIFGV